MPDWALYLLLGAGWPMATLAFGLWWGERGRREAAENWAVHQRPEGTPRAEVWEEKDAEERAHEAVAGNARSRLVRQLEQEGDVSREQAEAEADRLLGRAVGGGGRM